jgi:hypothetical protein
MTPEFLFGLFLRWWLLLLSFGLCRWPSLFWWFLDRPLCLGLCSLYKHLGLLMPAPSNFSLTLADISGVCIGHLGDVWLLLVPALRGASVGISVCLSVLSLLLPFSVTMVCLTAFVLGAMCLLLLLGLLALSSPVSLALSPPPIGDPNDLPMCLYLFWGDSALWPRLLFPCDRLCTFN